MDAARRAAYLRDGVVVVPDVLDATDLALLRAELDRLDTLGVFRDSSTSREGTSHEITRLDCISNVVRALLFDARIVDVVGALLEGPFALHMATCFKKQARTGLGTRWHSDNGQLQPDPDEVTGPTLDDPTRGLGLWVAIEDPADAADPSVDSPFAYVPGSRRADVHYALDPHSSYRQAAVLTPELERRVVRPRLAPGSAVLFSYNTLHSTADNTTARDRRALSLHFLALDQFTRVFPPPGGKHPALRGRGARGGEREYGADARGAWDALRKNGTPERRPWRDDDVVQLLRDVTTTVQTQIGADAERLQRITVELPLGAEPLVQAVTSVELAFLRAVDNEATIEALVDHVSDELGADPSDVRRRITRFASLLQDFGVIAAHAS